MTFGLGHEPEPFQGTDLAIRIYRERAVDVGREEKRRERELCVDY